MQPSPILLSYSLQCMKPWSSSSTWLTMSPKWLLILVLCLELLKVASDIVIETTKNIKKSEAWCGVMF